MNSFEWNKVIGALLATAMFFVVVGLVAADLFEIEQPEVKGYKVEGVEEAPAEKVVAEVEAGPSLESLLVSASAEKGSRVFGRCAACHSVQEGERHGIGPNLYGIVGAKVARQTDFGYSDALKDHGGDWDFALLDAYIEKPAAAIPDNRMTFGGIDRANQRADLLAYLRLQAADPVPLPGAEPAAEAEEPVVVTPDPGAPEPVVEETLEEVVAPPDAEPIEPTPKPIATETEEVPAIEEMTEASPLVAALGAASLERGKEAFSVCVICHSIDKGGAHKLGPNLYGVVGAAVGRHADFGYSPALAGQGGSWSFEALDAFLTSPSAAIPGNRMPFGGIKSLEDRADLIIYLLSRSDNPPDLP